MFLRDHVEFIEEINKDAKQEIENSYIFFFLKISHLLLTTI